MASKIDILKKYYMEDDSKKKVRKKKTGSSMKSKVKIIEANVDIHDLKAGDAIDSERVIEEDTPQIASVIDERPLEMRSFKKTFQNTSPSEESSSRRRRNDSSDESPPRKAGSKANRSDSQDGSKSPTRRRTRRDSSSDESPPRRRQDSSREAKKDEDSDASPPRRSRKKSDSDLDSPPRRRRRRENPDREIAVCEVIEGPETIKLRGDRKATEAAAKKEEAEKTARRKAIYDKWTAGIVQQRQRESYVEDVIHEANKPLARNADDADLEDRLRAVEREDDPMLAFIKKKKQKSQPDRPRYNGPQGPPNRYQIHPGYRWDGVDRSNGFENKMMSMKADKIANEEEAYKWSVEDM